MLSIGEFSKICEVTTKTLRYYEEIGLLKPAMINDGTGYRYYAIEQLETMLLINRLKSYKFTLDEIKEIIKPDSMADENLYMKLENKKRAINHQIENCQRTLRLIENDLKVLEQGKPIMSYLEEIGVQLVEVPVMCLLSVRLMVQKEDFPMQYEKCFGRLFRTIQNDKLTMTGSPMVLFHSDEFTVNGFDTEFAIPVKEYVTGTRNFSPGLCIKTVLNGSYSNLSSVYARQRRCAEKEGYKNTDAVFEVYVTDPSYVKTEDELITEVYNPVKKL